MFKKIKALFKSTKEPAWNINHPDLSAQVEFAFECKGVKYYRMSNDFHLPTGRYKWLSSFLEEVEMRMSADMLRAYLDKIEKALNGSSGDINLTVALVNINNIRTHISLGFEPETVKRLASVVYFDETEDLRDYDQAYAKKKIASWETDSEYAFFLTRPISELLNLNGISPTSLQNYIREAQEIIKDLTSDPLTA